MRSIRAGGAKSRTAELSGFSMQEKRRAGAGPSLLRLCKFFRTARGLTVVVLVVAGILAKLRGVDVLRLHLQIPNDEIDVVGDLTEKLNTLDRRKSPDCNLAADCRKNLRFLTPFSIALMMRDSSRHKSTGANPWQKYG